MRVWKLCGCSSGFVGLIGTGQVSGLNSFADQACYDGHASSFAFPNTCLAIGRGFIPDVCVPHPLFDLKFFAAMLRVEFACEPDAHQSLPASPRRLRSEVKEALPKLHGVVSQCQDDFFFVGEVVVDGSFGVLHAGRDAVHRQGVETFLEQNRLGDPEDFLGSQLNFSLFSR